MAIRSGVLAIGGAFILSLLLNAASAAAPHASGSEKSEASQGIEKLSQSDQSDLLFDQVDALRQENQDLSLRLAALEEGATPQAESSADRFSRMSIAVLGAATLLLALRVRKLK